MMQQQSTNLQQQQLQQQQLLLQRQHQQQQKLKQQQQQQLQQLHLQLHPLSPPPPPLVSANLTAAATGTTTPKGTTTETMAGTQDYQLQQQQMQTQMGAQPFSQIRQGGPPPSPSSSLTTSSGYPTLQQRRASLLQQQQQRPVPVTLSLPSAVVDEASACPSSSLPSVLINPFNNNNRTKNSHPLLSSERTPLRTPMLPLSSQEYQGIVASGALPVRQALQTHIATSGVKPPETKEEARAALEVMFQVRADKIRRAIEQGKLATAEALQHKVIKRRESIVEGTRKTSNKSHHRDRSMSAPSERVTFADTAASAAIVPPHSMQNRIVPNQPWFPSLPHHQNPHPHPAAGPVIGQEPISMHPYGTINVLQEGIATSQMSTGAGISLSPEATAGATAGDPMVIDGDDLPPPHSHPHQQDLQRQHQDTTFGLLSDDDLMSSFTIFAAKLGDSLLARDNFVHERGGPSSHQPQPSYGYNNTFGSTVVHNQQDSNNRSGVQLQTQEPPLEMMMVDTALPTLSPTASNESQSSSPWIPWHSGRGNGQEQDLVANSLRGGGAVAVHPFAQAAQPATALLPPQPPQGASHVSISSLVTNPQQQQQQQQQQAYQTMFTKDPRDQSLHYHHHPSAASAFGLGVQSVQIHPQAGFGGGVAGMSQGSGGSNVGEKQVEAWNQYVQYLLHQQEMAFNVGNTLSPPHQHPQQHQQQNVQQVLFGQQQQQQVGAGLSYMNSDGPGPGPGPGHPTHPDATQNQLPSTQTMDPHWQATMMTMMMDKNPTSEAIQGLGQQPGFYIANGVGIGAMAGTAGGG
ncbi:MAG: hypothetical protein J3R72DRAFT_458546 [Linnemannia gamsii]|nr:MAG: hypothetical protein J3R72DRAFT_458546 [Linnemannia gamsii]